MFKILLELFLTQSMIPEDEELFTQLIQFCLLSD